MLLAALVLGLCSPAVAQAPATDAKPSEPQKPADTKRDPARKADEPAETAKLTGPAANPECRWLGERVINLLSRDDLDTAFRHLDLYDRFGCPGAHVQISFRCLLRGGLPDPKAAETLDKKVSTCWSNPSAQPEVNAASAPPAQNPPAAAGTGAR
jgi:hypothetical protein